MKRWQKLSGSFPKREKKKAETRQKIIDAGNELFHELSFGDVTLEDVAERAGIHVQTLYRHFPNKMSLMVAGDEHWLNKFREHVQREEHVGNTFNLWRNWLRYSYREYLEDAPKYKKLQKRKTETPVGAAVLWGIQIEYENTLCELLAKDFGMSADGVGVPRLVAGMMVSGNAAVFRRFFEADTDLLQESIDAIDKIEELFKHLIVKRSQKRAG